MSRLGFAGNDETLQTVAIGRLRSATSTGVQVTAATPSTPGTVQVLTIASGSPGNETTYSVRFRDTNLGIDETISVTTDASATAGELETLIGAAYNANPVLAGLGTAVVGSDVVITMLDYTTDVTATETSAATVLTITETTAPSAASDFPFGKWAALSAGSGRLTSAQFGAITDPTRASVTYTITNDASGSYSSLIIAQGPDGVASESVSWAGDASAGTTDDNAVAAIEAAFAQTGMVVTNPSEGSVVLTLPIGWSVSVGFNNASGGSADLSSVVVEPGAVPEIGWVMDPKSDAPNTIGGDVTGIPGGKAAPILLKAAGEICVDDPGATITYGGAVFVEAASGATNGRPYTVQSATGSRIQLPKAQAYWVEQEPSNPDLAVIFHA